MFYDPVSHAHAPFQKTGTECGQCRYVDLHMARCGCEICDMGTCAGLGEAILCRHGHAVPLTMPHSPATSKEERERVKEAGGFISQVWRS